MATENEITPAEAMATDAQQAAVKAATQGKFAKRGFRSPEEVSEAAKAAGEAEPNDPQEAAAEADANAGEPPTHADFSFETEVPDEFAEAEVTPEAAAAPERPAARAAPEDEIRIGTRTFSNQKEAWAYAQELEQERIANDAFRQGIEAAQNGPKGNLSAEPPQPPPEEEIPIEVMYDPKKLAKWVSDKAALAKEQAKVELRQEDARRQKHKEVWDGFYSDYPDLTEASEIVDIVFQREFPTLQHTETKKALKIIADKAREVVTKVTRSKLPAKELKPTKQPTTAGSGAPVTTRTPEKTPLNFVSQQKNLKSSAGRAEARKRLGLSK